VYHLAQYAGGSATYEVLFAEWTDREWRIVSITFRTEGENDALEIAEDIALLDGTELIYLRKT